MLLVVHRHHSRRTENRLVQPAQPKKQEQRADDELQRRFRHGGDDQLAKRDHEHAEGDYRCGGAQQRSAPPACQADGEHDRERLSRLDR